MDHNSLVNEVVNNPKTPKEFACSNEITKLRKELDVLKPAKDKKEPKEKSEEKSEEKPKFRKHTKSDAKK